MALRSAHGKAAKYSSGPRVEVPKLREVVASAKELLAQLPVRPEPVANRSAAGSFVKGPGTSEIARKGGKAKGKARQLRRLMGVWAPPPGHPAEGYLQLANEVYDAMMTSCAALAGGVVSPEVAAINSTAALEFAARAWTFDRAFDVGSIKAFQKASALGGASRQNSLAAFHLAQLQATARGASPGNNQLPPWFEADDEPDDEKGNDK